MSSRMLLIIASLMIGFQYIPSTSHALLSKEFISKCMGCHGERGISGYSYFPNLAGQNQKYLFNQLKSFRDGGRQDLTLAVMPYMVAGLTDEQLESLALTFSSMPSEVVSAKEMSKEDQRLFEVGKGLIVNKSVTCTYCHLANPAEDKPVVEDYPVLVGQQKNYLMGQIKAFRDKKRWNAIMNNFLVGDLTDEQIEGVATYLRYKKAH